MEINFIITCFNKEQYWPYLRTILNSYIKIQPHIAYCYNGKNEKEICDFKCENRGQSPGDADLIIGGYRLLKNNGIKKWIKLSVDSWLLNEDIILDIFNNMEKKNMWYGGATWVHSNHMATDIIFATTELLEEFCNSMKEFNKNINMPLEQHMYKIVTKRKYYLIPGRHPVPYGSEGTRHIANSLGWTMQHKLEDNIAFMNNYHQ
jgi:hypothetical protein